MKTRANVYNHVKLMKLIAASVSHINPNPSIDEGDAMHFILCNNSSSEIEQHLARMGSNFNMDGKLCPMPPHVVYRSRTCKTMDSLKEQTLIEDKRIILMCANRVSLNTIKELVHFFENRDNIHLNYYFWIDGRVNIPLLKQYVAWGNDERVKQICMINTYEARYNYNYFKMANDNI